MPELPDIEVYRHCLTRTAQGLALQTVSVRSPFVVRTFDPPMEEIEGKTLTSVGRLGKRIVLCFEPDLYLVLHLMIAGRLLWKSPGAKAPAKITLAAFQFPNGVLCLTEASSKKRASLHLVRGREALAAHEPGGAEPLEIDSATFASILRRENHTLKRSLTDPRLIAGIGNAYSDEILHAARLSPLRLTAKLDDADIARLHEVMQSTLIRWRDLLLEQFRDRFPGPGDITAFRPDFAVHGKFGKPCPVCGAKVQRIRYASNETNYCPRCQTDGKVLADRSLSRLLKDDWPGNVEALER